MSGMLEAPPITLQPTTKALAVPEYVRTLHSGEYRRRQNSFTAITTAHPTLKYLKQEELGLGLAYYLRDDGTMETVVFTHEEAIDAADPKDQQARDASHLVRIINPLGFVEPSALYFLDQIRAGTITHADLLLCKEMQQPG